MQDASYLDAIEVSETSQQLSTLHDMILKNNKTGFEFNPPPPLQYIRVYFKYPLPIAGVEILTPRSNVKQISLSYFDKQNQTIEDANLQNWSITYISQYGRENNSIDRLCPNVLIHGIQVDILHTDLPFTIAHNVTLRVFIRPCEGKGMLKKKRKKISKRKISFFFVAACPETNILTRYNVERYESINPLCFASMGDAYENGNGASCGLTNPEFLVKFNGPALASVSKVHVQREHAKFPGNVQQASAVFLNANYSIIKNEVTGEPITWTSPADEPTISTYVKDISGLILKVLKTDNNETVRRLRVRIHGCYSAGLNI